MRRRQGLALLLGTAGGVLIGPLPLPARVVRLEEAAPFAHGDVCFYAPPWPYEPESGQRQDAARAVPETARCPVCGMFPARRPEWAAQVLFSNGDAQFLDSPASLAVFLARLAHYAPGRQRTEVTACYVRPVDMDGWLPAEQVHFVSAASILGPMRSRNYRAFADGKRARQHAAERQGEVWDLDGMVRVAEAAEAARTGAASTTGQGGDAA